MRRSGYNTNLASEYHVMSLLHRLGYEASLSLGNKKAVDIVVVRQAGDAATIDVKAVAGKDDWLVGNVPATPRKNHFIALVTYDGKIADVQAMPRAWILPHKKFLPLVKTMTTPRATLKWVTKKEVSKLNKYRDAWY